MKRGDEKTYRTSLKQIGDGMNYVILDTATQPPSSVLVLLHLLLPDLLPGILIRPPSIEPDCDTQPNNVHTNQPEQRAKVHSELMRWSIVEEYDLGSLGVKYSRVALGQSRQRA
jgi:hypothetical protein